VPVPATAFPHANSRDELKELIAASTPPGGQAMDFSQMRERVKERLGDPGYSGRALRSNGG
jgi:hypothetical protein